MFLSELGTTYTVYIGGVAVLLALWLLMSTSLLPRAYLLAGAFLGVALDIKLTNVFLVCGWVAAVVGR